MFCPEYGTLHVLKIDLQQSRIQKLSYSSRSSPPAKKSRSSLGDVPTFVHQDTNPPGSIISPENLKTNKNLFSSPSNTFESELSNQTKRKSAHRSVFLSLNAKTDHFERSKPGSSRENNLAAVLLPKRNFLSGDRISHSTGIDKNKTALLNSSDVYVDGADKSDKNELFDEDSNNPSGLFSVEDL